MQSDAGRRDRAPPGSAPRVGAGELLGLAKAALAPLAGAGSGEAVELLAEVDAAAERESITCALAGGEAAARAALLDAVAGAELFAGRGPGDPPLVIAAGEVDRGSVRQRDGSRRALIAPERSLQPAPRRPPWWALWSRLAWWLGRRSGARRAAEGASRSADLATAIAAAARDPRTAAIELELSGARLPEGAVIADVASAAEAARLGLSIDGCLFAGSPEQVGAAFPGVHLVELPRLFSVDGDGPRPEIEAAILAVSRRRATALGRRALRIVSTARAELDAAIERRELELAARLAVAESLRFDDPAGFAEAELASARRAIVQLVPQLIHQLSTQLASELERLGRSWTAALRGAASNEQLRAASAQIAAAAPGELAGIRADLGRLATAALRGAAHELLAGAIESMPHCSGSSWPAPIPGPVDLAPVLGSESTAQLLPSGSRLGSLFRSADSRRSRSLESLSESLTTARLRAEAELLDSEPALEEAVFEPLRRRLIDAAQAHANELADRRTRMRVEVARERAGLESTIGLRDRVAGAERVLASAVGGTSL